MSDFDNFDEFDAVRDFRSTVGLLDAAADERIRGRIVELARSRGVARDSLDVIVLEPTLDLRDPQELRVPAPSRSIDDASAAAVVELPAARQPSASRPTRLMAAAAAIVVVVLAATLAMRSRTGEGPETEIHSAAVGNATVAELAATAAAQPATPLTDAKPYLYTKTRRGNLGGGGIVRTEVEREDWMDRANQIKTRTGPTVNYSLGATPTSSSDGAGTDTASLVPGVQPFAGFFTYDQVQNLSPSVDPLRASIVAALRSQGSNRTRVIGTALDLLAMPITPPAVRAGLFQLLAAEGFVDVGDRTDLAQRVGSGFELTVDGTTFTVVVERANATLLGYQEVVGASGTPLATAAAPGSIVSFAVYELATVTDQLT